MTDSENYYIGEVHDSAVAQGRDARATKESAPVQHGEIAELIMLLRREIEAHEKELAEPDEIRGSTDFVDEELQKARPNVSVIRTVLSGMIVGAGQAASVIEVIARLQRAVSALV